MGGSLSGCVMSGDIATFDPHPRRGSDAVHFTPTCRDAGRALHLLRKFLEKVPLPCRPTHPGLLIMKFAACVT